MESAIYVGRVEHRRETPVVHEFRYRLALLYLDLAELDRVFEGRWLWSVERPNLASFRRRDYWGDPARPLDESIRELVAERTGRRPAGAIRLLTHPRYFGYVLNPLSLYFCFDAEERVEAIVGDVTNTPWNERHAYVLEPEPGAPLRFETPKRFHVSPFMGMEMRYRWAFTVPGERLRVAIASHEDGKRFFHAALDLERRPLDGANLARVLATHPFQTAKVSAAIYWQAARLRQKRVPYQPHPGRGGLEREEPIRS